MLPCPQGYHTNPNLSRSAHVAPSSCQREGGGGVGPPGSVLLHPATAAAMPARTEGGASHNDARGIGCFSARGDPELPTGPMPTRLVPGVLLPTGILAGWAKLPRAIWQVTHGPFGLGCASGKREGRFTNFGDAPSPSGKRW